MKRLETSPISDTSQFPVKKGTLVFLQDAYKEMMDAFCRGVIGTTYDFGKVYVLYGCVNTGTYPIYTISAGAIIYNGEIFFTNAVSFTATGSNVGVWKLVSTYYTVDADPVTLTDASVVNMHRIKKYEVQNGASGSGSQDYSASVFYPFASKKYTDDSIGEEAATRNSVDASLQSQINTINQVLTTVVGIGAWDMFTGATTLPVAHGLADITKIRSVSVSILDDSNSGVKDLCSYDIGADDGSVNGGVYSVDSINVNLKRKVGGDFSSTSYGGASNRGYITIRYAA